MKTLVFDTSAFLTFLGGEAGAGMVEEHLRAARAGKVAILASFISRTEIFYVIAQKRGEEKAVRSLCLIEALPVQWIHSDDALCLEAAKMKARYRLSLADAFVAATARQAGAVLVHKDPEFDALQGLLPLAPLPYKM